MKATQLAEQMSPTSTCTPMVSVILPAYNSERFISETLSSVLQQDFTDYEVIVINDGSDDSTSDVVRRCADPRIRLIEQSNGGISEARNTGIKLSRGRYIAFIDHDDYWHPNKLSAQLKALEDSDSLTAICFGEFERWQDGTPPKFRGKTPSAKAIDTELSGWLYHKLLLTNWVLLSTSLFRKEVFANVGLFDPELPPADDWDMVLRASRRYKFIKLSDPTVLYRVHPGQTSRKRMARDYQFEIRHSTILRYGRTGPDGGRVDEPALLDRDIRSRLSFFSALLQHGDRVDAMRALLQMFRLSMWDRRCWRATVSLVLSFARRSRR